MTAHNVQNILATYQLASLIELAAGRQWYPEARQIAVTLAERYSVPAAQAVGVLAALSPRNRWERNVIDAERLISAYVSGGYDQAEAVKVCTFTSNKIKALRILESGLETVPSALEILSGPKLREFASCIAGLPDCCIDGHAYCIWAGERSGLAQVPSIGVKLRREIKADYAAAADQLGITAAECQAVTWVAWRRLHGVTK